MDIRPARLMISHPAAQHSRPHMSLLSPNPKSIYNLDYFHQVSSQLSDRFRTQQGEFFNSNVTNTSNGNRVSYSNERNTGSRYSNSNGNQGNKYSNKTSTSNSSASPPLSVTSSGSSTTSGKNNRASKSYGNTMHSMNNHRNMPTTPNMQQPHSGFFQSQSMPFFHSTSSNGMQQIFSAAMSPKNQPQHTNQSVGMYVHNTSTAYHSNNNYHTHNRNYQGNGNKKNWHYSR